jgi:hypothetical protein
MTWMQILSSCQNNNRYKNEMAAREAETKNAIVASSRTVCTIKSIFLNRFITQAF